MKETGWTVDEVLRGSGRCVSPLGGGGGGKTWSRWRLEGRLLEGGSPLGGGEKAVCVADKIHDCAEHQRSSMHHLLQLNTSHCCQ